MAEAVQQPVEVDEDVKPFLKKNKKTLFQINPQAAEDFAEVPVDAAGKKKRKRSKKALKPDIEPAETENAEEIEAEAAEEQGTEIESGKLHPKYDVVPCEEYSSWGSEIQLHSTITRALLECGFTGFSQHSQNTDTIMSLFIQLRCQFKPRASLPPFEIDEMYLALPRP